MLHTDSNLIGYILGDEDNKSEIIDESLSNTFNSVNDIIKKQRLVESILDIIEESTNEETFRLIAILLGDLYHEDVKINIDDAVMFYESAYGEINSKKAAEEFIYCEVWSWTKEEFYGWVRANQVRINRKRAI